MIEQMIKHRLGLHTEKVAARKCRLVELDTPTRRAFMNAHHLEGDARATAAFGLVYDNRLMAAISVRTPFHKKHKEYIEVGRYAQADVSAQGMLSRLTKPVTGR